MLARGVGRPQPSEFRPEMFILGVEVDQGPHDGIVERILLIDDGIDVPPQQNALNSTQENEWASNHRQV
jgi:hypothetical protein